MSYIYRNMGHHPQTKQIRKLGKLTTGQAKKTTTINNTKVKEFLEKKLPRD